MVVFGIIEIVAGLESSFADGVDVRGGHFNGIEKLVCDDAVATLDEFGGEVAGIAVNPHRNLADSLGAVPYGIHSCHYCHKGGSRADVRGGLVAFDVLLASLERKTVAGVSETVDRSTDDAAGKAALVLVTGGHKAGGWASETHRKTEPLS